MEDILVVAIYSAFTPILYLYTFYSRGRPASFQEFSQSNIRMLCNVVSTFLFTSVLVGLKAVYIIAENIISGNSSDVRGRFDILSVDFDGTSFLFLTSSFSFLPYWPQACREIEFALTRSHANHVGPKN